MPRFEKGRQLRRPVNRRNRRVREQKRGGSTSTSGLISHPLETSLPTRENGRRARTAECWGYGEGRENAAVNKKRAFWLGTKTIGSPGRIRTTTVVHSSAITGRSPGGGAQTRRNGILEGRWLLAIDLGRDCRSETIFFREGTVRLPGSCV